MKVKLVFWDWRDSKMKTVATDEENMLTMGEFHSGSTFKADITVSDNDELLFGLESGYRPMFYAVPVKE